MKDMIAGILALTVLVWAFSCGTPAPYEYPPKEGWTFFGGSDGDPIPQDGGEGKMDVFTLNSQKSESTEQKQTTEAQQQSPITVSVEQPTGEQTQTERDTFLCGVSAGALSVEIVMLLTIGVYWLISRKGRKIYKHRPGGGANT